jgi:hypothetical protein
MRRFIRLKASPRRETFTGTFLIQRREVVGWVDLGGEAHQCSLRVRLPSLVQSRDPTVPLRAALLAALRSVDADQFRALVDTYGGAMHRVALTLVRSSAVADEVAQEAWRGALRSLDRFEGSPRQQRAYAPEPCCSATGQTPASRSPSAWARRASGVLRRMEGSLPHQAMAFGFAAETRDPLARN